MMVSAAGAREELPRRVALLAALLAVALLIYLLAVLLRPEDFS